MAPSQPPVDKHYFEVKGKSAEVLVTQLAEKSFFVDWCFPNPKLPDGKELCDVLVVFGDIVIIWQIKDLKVARDGQFKDSDMEKNLKQLSGARRQLMDLKTPVALENSRRTAETFDPNKVKEVYLISTLLGDDVVTLPLIDQIKSYTAHVFTKDFLQIVLNELDTIVDFINYLREKEAFLKKIDRLIISGGEEELLAYYLMHGRKFKSLEEATFLNLDDGFWKRYFESEEYKYKAKENQISYYWDSVIDRAHEDGKPTYEQIARELAGTHRFERRVLGEQMWQCQQIAHNSGKSRHRVYPCDERGTTYCFMFRDATGPDREKRLYALRALCEIARVKYPGNTKVVGISTDREIKPTCGYEYIVVNEPTITQEFRDRVEALQKETGYLTNAKAVEYKASEYYPPE